MHDAVYVKTLDKTLVKSKKIDTSPAENSCYAKKVICGMLLICLIGWH